MWRGALASAGASGATRSHHYVDLIRNLHGLARYLAKDIRQGGAVVPKSFPRRVFGCSQNTLPGPIKILWREICQQRARRARK
jgi:hypothetical protein